ncbi:MFS transporter [Exophiala viscosa]|uniref:MFS transporter n=1 Tax=Exophiala viscosa TaxID=2486360 RepID=A0AAN6DML0_9EURO|nr:MFS transporter [Exophiala viscosa]KAI1621067.1 MFS transporter [Exophiala viscosa]
MRVDAHDETPQSVDVSSHTSLQTPVNASSPPGTHQFYPSDVTLRDEPPADAAPDDVPVGRRDSKKIIQFGPDDPESPYNWSKGKKLYVFFAAILTVLNSTMGSSLPSNAIDFIAKDFNVTATIQLPLPISCFLAGYVVGPTLCGPLSENNGRKPVIFGFFLFSTIFSMACAVAPNWPALLIFRFFCGIGYSGPIAIVGGLYADIYNDPRQRGLAMAWFMVATSGGPVAAPVISGFIAENTTWRWVFAVGTLFSVAVIPIILLMPETYTPILLSRKAKRLRKETGDDEIIARSDLQKKTLRHVLTVVMTRPYRMLFQEVIVMCTCAYISLAYGIFYMYFEAYPVIFQGPDSVYKWSPGVAGLAFLPIALGALLAAPIYLGWDSYLAKARTRGAKWAQQEEYRRLPLACIGGPLYVVSLFWIGWSARPDMFWLAPVASGVTFGIGFVLIFMALLNYLTDAYETFAASAQGIASTCRSMFGVLLPLASAKMFSSLGIAWSCSLLGFLAMGMCIIPFAFLWYGDQIRANSKFCQQLKEMKEQEAAEWEETEREEAQNASEKAGRPSDGDNLNSPTPKQEERIYDKV